MPCFISHTTLGLLVLFQGIVCMCASLHLLPENLGDWKATIKFVLLNPRVIWALVCLHFKLVSSTIMGSQLFLTQLHDDPRVMGAFLGDCVCVCVWVCIFTAKTKRSQLFVI
jgi:hypothetical protein